MPLASQVMPLVSQGMILASQVMPLASQGMTTISQVMSLASQGMTTIQPEMLGKCSLWREMTVAGSAILMARLATDKSNPETNLLLHSAVWAMATAWWRSTAGKQKSLRDITSRRLANIIVQLASADISSLTRNTDLDRC